MKIAVTGATGLLGRYLLQVIATKPGWIPIPVSRKFLNLEETDRIVPFFHHLQPQAIIHAAALTGVDLCEHQPELADRINHLATAEIAKAAEHLGIPLLYISTDFVFDGEKGRYREEDEPHPINVYGRTKWLGEQAVQRWEKHYIVRTSWIFGVGGKTFFSQLPELIRQKRPLQVTEDQWSCPTYAPVLAEQLVRVLEQGLPYGTYHLAGEEAATPLEFVEHLRRVSGLSLQVQPKRRAEIHSAPRPRMTILENHRLKAEGIYVPGYPQFLKRFWKEATGEKRRHIP